MIDEHTRKFNNLHFSKWLYIQVYWLQFVAVYYFFLFGHCFIHSPRVRRWLFVCFTFVVLACIACFAVCVLLMFNYVQWHVLADLSWNFVKSVFFLEIVLHFLIFILRLKFHIQMSTLLFLIKWTLLTVVFSWHNKAPTELWKYDEEN